MSNVILDLLPFTLRFKKGPQLFRTDIASSITMSVSRLKTSQGLFTRHHQFQQKTTAIGNRQGEHTCIHASHPIPSHPILFIFNIISFQAVAVVISSRSIHPWSMTLFHQNFQWSRALCFTFNGLARMPTLMETQAGTPVGPGSEVNKNPRYDLGID